MRIASRDTPPRRLQTAQPAASCIETETNEASVTALGEQIVRRAQQVLEQAAAIKGIVKSGKNPVRRPLLLGIIYTIGPYLLPDLLRQAITQVPPLPFAAGREEAHSSGLAWGGA